MKNTDKYTDISIKMLNETKHKAKHKSKQALVILMLLILILTVFTGCSKKTSETPVTVTTEVGTESAELSVFTLEELAKYNGKDGMPAYVGYEGNVYDVSNIPEWKGGIHNAKYEAGQDLTEILNNVAPHSPSRLTENAPLVGTLEGK